MKLPSLAAVGTFILASQSAFGQTAESSALSSTDYAQLCTHAKTTTIAFEEFKRVTLDPCDKKATHAERTACSTYVYDHNSLQETAVAAQKDCFDAIETYFRSKGFEDAHNELFKKFEINPASIGN